MEEENVELLWEYPGKMQHGQVSKQDAEIKPIVVARRAGGKALDFFLHVSWNMVAAAVQLSGLHPKLQC